MKTTQWEITKYSHLIEQSDIELREIGIITTKIYKYQDKYFIEVWDNGYCIHFGEVID